MSAATGTTENGRFRPWHEPTEAQKVSGRYPKPRLSFAGLDIAIENPAGSVRCGVDKDGTPWETRMVYPYGYIEDSQGVDGDEVDCYVGPNVDAPEVYVVHQRQAGDWDAYDEDKVMIGFDSQDEAERAYLLHYNDERFLGEVTAMPFERFKSKVLATKQAPAMIKSQLVDLSGLSCGCADHALEMLSKAFSEDGPDIWAEHENPFIKKLIEQFTQKGLMRHEVVKSELTEWMAGTHFVPQVEAVAKPGMMPVWNKDELSLVKLYLEHVHPSQYELEDWDYLVSYLVQRYLPADELMTDAEWLVAKSYLLGKAQAHMPAASPVVAELVAAALPTTLAGITFKLSDAERQILQYGKLHAVESVVSLAEQSKHALKRVVLDHMAKVAQGDQSVTTGQLEQRLFDQFGAMNRDWRRIATTEAGEIANQGVIASVSPGGMVKRLEMYHGACPFCRKIDGRVFSVKSADDPDKNGETDVWPGKNNIGRSSSPRKRTENGLEPRLASEMWWVSAGVQHPHCRGQWLPLQETADDEFAAWMREQLGIEHGLKLNQWVAIPS